MIPYGKQHIDATDIAAVTEALTSPFLTQGPKVREFEEAFAAYVHAPHALAVSNGTAALHLAALALGVDHNTTVICTPITFAASANSIRYCGGKVLFADVDPQTALIDINSVRSLLESHPKGSIQGIVVVDFAGNPVDLHAFRKLADEYGCWIIEDACHAPGGYFIDSEGQKHFCGDGSLADISAFSFHPVKHIACGEGGMVTTASAELHQKMAKLRSHGMAYQHTGDLIENHGGWYMEMQQLGFNYRMPDLLCALGLSQLAKADAGLERRQQIAQKYDAAFENTAIGHLTTTENALNAYHLYVIKTAHRKGMYDYLREHQIFAQVHYVPVHMMPYYQNMGQPKLPHAEKYYEECLSLPMYPSLTDAEQDFVMEKVLAFNP